MLETAVAQHLEIGLAEIERLKKRGDALHSRILRSFEGPPFQKATRGRGTYRLGVCRYDTPWHIDGQSLPEMNERTLPRLAMLA